ncbi:MAG: hypothetical protein QM692_18680 [Thermomicrobiales bacterium]
MDGSQIDDLARALRRSAESRRRILASGISGIALGGLALAGADARKKRKKKKKKKSTTPPPTCVSQQNCGSNCRCFFDVTNALACYDLGTQGACCDSAAECGPNQGCVSGACSAGGKAGGCFSLCAS